MIHNRIYKVNDDDLIEIKPEYFIISKVQGQNKTIFLKKVDEIPDDVVIHKISDLWRYTIFYDRS